MLCCPWVVFVVIVIFPSPFPILIDLKSNYNPLTWFTWSILHFVDGTVSLINDVFSHSCMWQVSLFIVHVPLVKQNWTEIYHCILLRQVLVWQWLVSSAPLPTVALWDGYGITLPSNGLVRNTRRTTEKRCEVSEDTGQKWKQVSEDCWAMRLCESEDRNLL